MQRKTLTAALAGAAVALAPGVAGAADQRTNAVKLMTTRCFQITSACYNIVEHCCASSIYAPPTWPAGSKRYKFTFNERGTRRAWSCYVYVRPGSTASGSVSC